MQLSDFLSFPDSASLNINVFIFIHNMTPGITNIYEYTITGLRNQIVVLVLCGKNIVILLFFPVVMNYKNKVKLIITPTFPLFGMPTYI